MYSPKINEFIRTYVKAIEGSNAAVFAGAGLSQPAGHVNWKELMRELADDLGLNVDLEADLVALAQYHVNEFDGRGKINQILIDEFTKGVQTTKNHELLADLPISTYWTTNYDALIETTLKNMGKKVDTKIVPENLAHTTPKTDAVIYKMHGDSSLPHQAVLTKDDYEGYNITRQLYSTALQGDLVSKTFLFIGFSFDDPNLTYILSRIRLLLGENSRTHYCFMKQIERKDYETEEEFHYAQIKQQLRINDLKRYKITVLLVNSYHQITEILKKVHDLVKRGGIFISGSATFYDNWNEQQALQFSTNLSKSIIQSDNNIVSGFGLGIGSCIISGALEELYKIPNRKVEERLKARPFPQYTTGDLTLKELWTKYRNDMLSSVGIAIFIFGNKMGKSKEKTDANGMIEEFEIAITKGVIPIPIGATGDASLTIWTKVMDDFDNYVGIPELKDLYEQLGDTKKTPEELIAITIKIIKHLKK
ncbi:SIR2 family protein [Bacillus thuringiensis]|uniref:SIR2 family protein n=1 Tax=Bacillus thuringiensis TaxID=1428 RepID=UPI000BF815F7|nr:SIR2 family protein [Bacillus thuringiensis]PEZ30673.1 hypothetical protein CN346_22370 [Bacillus thuringiensis]